MLPALAGQSEPARIGWCHGDAGGGAALLAAAPAAGLEDTWRERALDLCRRAARQAPSGDDPALPHGAAGLGHIFHRCHHATGEPLFRRRLAPGTPARSIGSTRRRRAAACSGAGIGLALLAATTRVEPAWDRAFLLSIRPPV
jgi:hypothetical protein